MTNYAEDVLFTLLSDTEALEELVADGMPLECIPTEDARPIVQWCMDQFFVSDMTRAPSIEMIRQTWGQQLEDLEIDLGDGTETDTMESVIAALKRTYVEFKTQEFIKDLGTKMAKAGPLDKEATLHQGTEDLWHLSSLFVRADTTAPSTTAATAAVRRYEERVRNPSTFRGMSYGIDVVDDHYMGIHPGELAILGAGPKVGKSWYAGIVAFANWLLGYHTILVTLENSHQMTWDRLVCLAAGLDYTEFQKGHLGLPQNERLRQADRAFSITSNQIKVVSPEDGRRTARAIVESARLEGAEALIIDQLTFMEHPSPGRKPRNEVIRDILHDLRNAISSRKGLPCLLTHQINREGIKAADKTGFLEMYHMAEGSEVERTADHVFGLYQDQMDKMMGTAKFQGLADRRVDSRSWNLKWAPALGQKPESLGLWTPSSATTKQEQDAA